MKILPVFVLGGALLCPPIALADYSFDAGRFGYMKGVLDTCSNVAPQEASAYLLRIKSFVGNANKSAVSEAMRTEEYHQAYESIRSGLREQMSHMSRKESVATCTSYLTAN